MLKRIRSAPQGKTHRIRKRLSNIIIIIDSKK
jgi:ribosomal protein L22